MIEQSISSAKYFAAFGAGAVSNAAIAAMMPDEAEAFCTGLEVIAGGSVTVTDLRGNSINLGSLPAGWVRAIQFKAVEASSTTMILYRSTTEGIR